MSTLTFLSQIRKVGGEGSRRRFGAALRRAPRTLGKSDGWGFRSRLAPREPQMFGGGGLVVRDSDEGTLRDRVTRLHRKLLRAPAAGLPLAPAAGHV